GRRPGAAGDVLIPCRGRDRGGLARKIRRSRWPWDAACRSASRMENRPAASRTRPAVLGPAGRWWAPGGGPPCGRPACVGAGVGGWAAGERRGGGRGRFGAVKFTVE